MKNILGAASILGLLLFWGCNKPQNSVRLHTDFTQRPYAQIFAGISPNWQIFRFNPKNDTVLVTNGSNALFLPKNAFESAENVVLCHIQEFERPADQLCAGIHSLGVVGLIKIESGLVVLFTDINGKEVLPADSSKVVIEFASSQNNREKQVYYIAQVWQSPIYWNSTVPREPTLAVAPIASLSYPYGECPKNFGMTTDPAIWGRELAHLTYYRANPSAYEGTILATRDFERRYLYYCMPDLVATYAQNLRMPLWQIDTMMVGFFKRDLERRRKLGNNPFRTADKGYRRLNAYKWLISNDTAYCTLLIKRFTEFANEQKTIVDPNRKLMASHLNRLPLHYQGVKYAGSGVYGLSSGVAVDSGTIASLTVRSNMQQSLVAFIDDKKNILFATKTDDSHLKFLGINGELAPIHPATNGIIFGFARKGDILHFGHQLLSVQPTDTASLVLLPEAPARIKFLIDSLLR